MKKAGKSASSIDSFRPVSLTSCVAKTLERLIHNRLYFLAESRSWICPEQAGVRKQRGCEDLVLNIIQGVSDGFQQRPPKRSVMALLDYSKAYDRVWREELVVTALDQGVPPTYVKWIFSFLSDRWAKAQVNGEVGRARPMRQGLPQGSVLSPFLFLIYINSLRDVLPQEVKPGLYADDVSLLSSQVEKEEAEAGVQRAVDEVARWSARKKMRLNPDKSETAFFSTDRREASWSPNVSLGGTRLRHNPTPKFLGVTLDRTLSFGPHVEEVVLKVGARCRLLATLTSKDWGWRKHSMRVMFLALQQSIMNYAAPAWQPYLAKTRMEQLDRAQNAALRIITGLYRTTPLDILRLEAGVESYETTSRRLVVTSLEKAERLPPDHPRAKALRDPHPPHRLKRPSWRSAALAAAEALPAHLRSREPFPPPAECPWQPATGTFAVRLSVPGLDGGDQEEKRRKTLTAIRGLPAAVTIYTDGSATAGTADGGAAMIVTTGDPEEPRVVASARMRGAAITSSYDEETAAMALALDWLRDNGHHLEAAICTDSQSLLAALEANAPGTINIRNQLDGRAGSTVLQWVPGHCGVPGNERADEEAKAAAQLRDVEGRPVSYSAAKAAVRRHTKDGAPAHPRAAAVYDGYSWRQDSARAESRQDAVFLARLRSGHSTAFKAYNCLLNPEADPTCPSCGMEPHTLEHWLQRCPAWAAARQEILGDAAPPLDVLVKDPVGVKSLARRSL